MRTKKTLEFMELLDPIDGMIFVGRHFVNQLVSRVRSS